MHNPPSWSAGMWSVKGVDHGADFTDHEGSTHENIIESIEMGEKNRTIL